MLIDEINTYDKKTKEQEESLKEEEMNVAIGNKTRIKDYKKTSLLKAVTVFEEFLRSLEKAERNRKAENGKITRKCARNNSYSPFNISDDSMEF